jgi:hypothetical protein
MRRRSRVPRLLCCVMLALLVGACATASQSQTPAPLVTLEPEPTDITGTAVPSTTADPCASGLARVGTFVVRVGGTMAQLRALLLSKRFDAVATLGAMRHLSSLLDADAGILAVVGACPAMAALGTKLEPFLTNVGVNVNAALKAGFEAAGQRNAARQAFKLLRSLVTISAENAKIAAGLGLDTEVLVLPPGTTNPLGPLPPLPS